MDLRVCRYFLAIVDEGSMNKAARVLHITQPTLSRQIAQLEEELQIPLFERRSKTLHLTQSGLLFARRAREMVELENKMIHELNNVSSQIKGELIVGSGEMACNRQFLDIVRRFQIRYPQVSLTILAGTADQTREMMESGLIDLGLFINPGRLEGMNRKIWKTQEAWGAICLKEDPLAHHDTVTPEDLKGRNLIFPYRREPELILQDWMGDCLDEAHIVGRISLSGHAAASVQAGLGVALSVMGLSAYQQENLTSLPLCPAINSSVTIAWKERFPKPPVLTEFLEFLFDSLEGQIEDIE